MQNFNCNCVQTVAYRDTYVACWSYLPFEEEEVHIVVFLSEEVTKDTCWVGRAYLVGRQSKVHTLDEIPQLSGLVTREWSEK